MKKLTKPTEIVEVLGGFEGVAALTEAKDPAIWNWLNAFNAFPANTYFVMISALKRRGYTAPAYLWKMKGAEKPTTRKASSKSTKKRAA